MTDVEDQQSGGEILVCPYCKYSIESDPPTTEGDHLVICVKCKKEFFCSLEFIRLFSCDTPELRIKTIESTLEFLKKKKEDLQNYHQLKEDLKKEKLELLQMVKNNNRGR